MGLFGFQLIEAWTKWSEFADAVKGIFLNKYEFHIKWLVKYIHKKSNEWVNIGMGNGLVPSGTKP